ncbi:hypothetical protein GALMADRAFT_1272901 [Galerina marginata CBS 339.88]|uniref:Uncharacterized protein n=1 Tax=Galerina marginata (strain CBS 339.88) TaxID=685588 RepID=A0A067T6S0_GALM3|nr:hypothetical protein GALMADRAFT_1272901 [Galerina marginata CBS 339.88]
MDPASTQEPIKSIVQVTGRHTGPFPTFMATTAVICGYSVSGGYGPISRFLYYILLIVSLVFHNTEWLVSGTLGASMIFSSIAAVHAVALASARGRETVDLDIIPVYSITGVGMLIGVPLLVWSKTLREAQTSTRMLIFSWIGLMFVGAMASRASMAKLPEPFVCDDESIPGCPLTCNITLPMRQGQPIMVVPFHSSEFLDMWSILYSWLACNFTFMGLVFAHGRKHPIAQARAALRARGWSTRLRRKNAGRTANCAVCTPPLSIGVSIAHLILMESILLGPRGVPLGENMTAIGQWGPLVGASLALFASVIQWKFSDGDLRSLTGDVEVGDNSGPSSMSRAQAPITALASSRSESDSPSASTVKPYDVSSYFEEGRCWGPVANGMVMNHGGVKWVVRDGYLRYFESTNNTVESEEEPTMETSTLYAGTVVDTKMKTDENRNE